MVVFGFLDLVIDHHGDHELSSRNSTPPGHTDTHSHINYIDYIIGYTQILMCVVSLTLNIITIVQHILRHKKVASFLFCLLATSDSMKAFLSIYPSYNILKPQDDYKRDNTIGGLIGIFWWIIVRNFLLLSHYFS